MPNSAGELPASGTHPISPLTRLLLTVSVALLATATLAAFAASRAAAVSDAEELIRFGGLGTGAGQLSNPQGVATDPVTGHVFTAEEVNNRISEFTPWGSFVKAFGWDVAPGAVNEQQEVRVRATDGQFKLTFGASTTPDLAFNAPGSVSEGPGSVEAALNALPSIANAGAGGSVSVKAVLGASDGIAPSVYVIAFKGSLAGTNVDELTATNGTTPLSGGDPSPSLEARTRADGTAGGVGLESCTEESGCKAGLNGSGAGQANHPDGIAVDAAGNVYVKERGNVRVQKFDSAGRFVLMFGGEVDKTTSENICTAASTHECGIGTPGTAAGQFSSGFSSGIALGSSGRLFVADSERIQRFNLQGEFQASIAVPGEQVLYLAFDPVSEDLYATYAGKDGIHKLHSGTGAEIGKVLEGQGLLATDPAGNLYAQGMSGETQGKVVQYNSGGNPLTPPSCCDSGGFNLSGLATNAAGTLYVANYTTNVDSFVRAFGPGPVRFEAPPKVPPTISAQFATSVNRNGAVLGAEINPHFWTDTRFYLQYGEGKCSEGGCTSEKPVPPGTLLAKSPIDAVVKSSGVFLEGLKPGTTYHYRFLAESLGGGPVRGIGGEVGLDGEESSFTTYPAQSPYKSDCPNQRFRNGFAAPLPDCRAFEMVSPIDKNNGDIKALLDVLSWKTNLEQSSTDGNRFTYSSYRPFADPEASPYTSQYLATREDGVGWSSEALDPPQGYSATGGGAEISNLENSFKAFSPDLCESWLVVAAEPVLAPEATDGYRDLYRRNNCGAGGYEALIGVEPNIVSSAFIPELQGVSADGGEAIFRVKDKLTPEAASGVWQTYYTSDDGLRLICVLPSGVPSGGNCSAGTGDGATGTLDYTLFNRVASVNHAISAEGRRVYWTTSTRESAPGKVYLRLNPGEEQSAISGGECTEAEKACTLKVSETASTKDSRFLGASADGARALFEVTEGNQIGSLYLFDVETADSTLLAAKGRGVLGTSEDLSRIYFVSEEALEGAAQAGKPNLYLSQEGTVNFIATLSSTDVAPGIFSNAAFEAVFHSARVSPDGAHLAFISTEPLSGYDNTDQATGKADSEVYLYEAGSGGPVCVSCNPSEARPLGRIIRVKNNLTNSLPAAATIPAPQFNLHYPRSLSADGNYLFFNSFDALLPRDANGKADVYVWQAAAGKKECTEKGAELYVASSGGCLSLISSGQSSEDAEFLDASPGGGDVFFTTNASLLPQDSGLIDVYDARVGGGLPGAPEPPGSCQGEACQIAPPPPNDPTPASASFKGVGNLKPAPRCRKGRVARKGRCVAKKRKAAKRHAKRETNRNRGANR
jgi:DNA-binding beta-propeller fold protein YncE